MRKTYKPIFLSTAGAIPAVFLFIARLTIKKKINIMLIIDYLLFDLLSFLSPIKTVAFFKSKQEAMFL